ncbi:heme oxygenase 2 isoform b [Pimephales promelas]|nr:heme oxygenase 2 isoform b [Pimephales promelas]
MMAADSAENILTESNDDILSPDDLSEVLAAGTKESHDKAENSPFVKDFLRGRIKRELFKLGTTGLYYVYSAIEEEIEKNKEHPMFAPLYLPSELHRRDALAKDLEYFYGEDWESKISCSAATRPYVDRIHEVGRNDPVLLVAHAWTRYMGDLSGGQILKKVAQRALKLPPTGEGLNFYHFEGINNATAFKRLYRSRMNELEVDAETEQRLLDEANLAFKFNLDVRGLSKTKSVRLCDVRIHTCTSIHVLCFSVRCSQSCRRLGKTLRRKCRTSASLHMGIWVETSVNVPTMPPKWR